jgi:DNA-binding CsgD family transcriptional regulator
VKTHTKHVLARLGAKNRTHAVAIAVRECLID